METMIKIFVAKKNRVPNRRRVKGKGSLKNWQAFELQQVIKVTHSRAQDTRRGLTRIIY